MFATHCAIIRNFFILILNYHVQYNNLQIMTQTALENTFNPTKNEISPAISKLAKKRWAVVLISKATNRQS